MTTRFKKVSSWLAAAALFIGICGAALASEYEGSWMLTDTDGKPFEITLNKDGTATGTHKDTMKQGTWKEEDGAAVIHWNTGWTTRIAKEGDKYVKTAFKPGVPTSGRPANTSEARKKP